VGIVSPSLRADHQPGRSRQPLVRGHGPDSSAPRPCPGRAAAATAGCLRPHQYNENPASGSKIPPEILDPGKVPDCWAPPDQLDPADQAAMACFRRRHTASKGSQRKKTGAERPSPPRSFNRWLPLRRQVAAGCPLRRGKQTWASSNPQQHFGWLPTKRETQLRAWDR